MHSGSVVHRVLFQSATLSLASSCDTSDESRFNLNKLNSKMKGAIVLAAVAATAQAAWFSSSSQKYDVYLRAGTCEKH
jgi:hypothetical protein